MILMRILCGKSCLYYTITCLLYHQSIVIFILYLVIVSILVYVLGGKLLFSDNVDVTLHTENILITSGGILQVNGILPLMDTVLSTCRLLPTV